MANKIIVIVGVIVLISVSYLIYSGITEPVYTEGDRKTINIEPDPIQSTDSLITIAPIQSGNIRFFFTPQAKYSISGMLVSKRKYFRGVMSRFSPYDYALIWGNVSDLLTNVKFSQTYRFCFFKYKPSAIIDLNYVQTHMSNNHLVPANDNIRKAFRYARKKDLIKLDGYLVDVVSSSKNKGTSNWKTSTNREDTFAGACEIIYVVRLQIGDKIYE